MRIERSALTVIALTLLVRVAHAEDVPKADVAVGYSGMWVAKGYTFWLHGVGVSVTANVNSSLGLVGDFAAHHADPGVKLNTETYMFGPRFSYLHWSGGNAFAQALI